MQSLFWCLQIWINEVMRGRGDVDIRKLFMSPCNTTNYWVFHPCTAQILFKMVTEADLTLEICGIFMKQLVFEFTQKQASHC